MIKWRLNRSISRIDYGTTPFQVTKQKCKLWKGSLVRGSGNGSELMHYHYSVCPKFLKTLSFLSGICSPRIWQVNKFWWPSAFSSACQKKQTCHISFFLVLPDCIIHLSRRQQILLKSLSMPQLRLSLINCYH